jgi:hypothetical protein
MTFHAENSFRMFFHRTFADITVEDYELLSDLAISEWKYGSMCKVTLKYSIY